MINSDAAGLTILLVLLVHTVIGLLRRRIRRVEGLPNGDD